MPLSEEEQQILAQIEAGLLASDPELVKQVGSGAVSRDTKRRLRLSLLGFVAAIVGSILLLPVSYVLAFVAFLVAFASLVYAQADIRMLGRARISQTRNDFRAGMKESMRDIDDHHGRDAGNPFN